METTIMKQCQEELRQRLGKYDVVVPQEIEQDLAKDFKEQAEKWRLENASKVTAIEFIKQIFSDSQKENWNILRAMTNIHIFPQREVDVPDKIKDIYSKALNNLNIFSEKSWVLFEKDILRAIAYHDYVLGFELNEEDVKYNISIYEEDKYLNIPIKLRIQINKSKYCYVFPKVGGGMLDQEHLVIDHNKKNIFIKSKQAFDSAGEFTFEREKGVNYELLRKFIEDITSKTLSSSDIWFFKNVLDPELFTSIYLSLEEKNISNSDTRLIWILCGCKCPSIRLYVFEAIKPCYLYIRNNLKPNKDLIDDLLNELERIVRNININFQDMASYAAIIFDIFSEKSEETIANNYRLNEAFQKGDDFRFIFREDIGKYVSELHDGFDVFKDVNLCERECGSGKMKSEKKSDNSKKYYEYLVSKKDKKLDKIAYSVMTALNEQWGRTKERIQQQEEYKKMMSYQENYVQNLQYYLRINQ